MIPVPKKLQVNDFILIVEFSDGEIRQIDVRTFLGKGEKAEKVKTSLSLFKTAFIKDDDIEWKNGFSIDPDIIYEDGMVLKNLPISASTKKSFFEKISEKQKN